MTYKKPSINRALHPEKMNWLWRLICETGYITVEDVVKALRAGDVQVDFARARGWLLSQEDDGYFPLSIAELEQNLRLIRSARADAAQAGDAPASD